MRRHRSGKPRERRPVSDGKLATDHGPFLLWRNRHGTDNNTPHIDTVPIQQQTGQHVATLTSPTWSSASLAPPLLVDNKYLIWGMQEGKMALWTLHIQLTWTNAESADCHAPRRNIQPCYVLDIPAAAPTPWMQISQIITKQHEPPQLLGLTSAGVFCHVKLVLVNTNGSDNDIETHTEHQDDEQNSNEPDQTDALEQLVPQLQLVDTWYTNRPNTSCFGTTYSGNTILVAYQNGLLEAYREQKPLWLGNFQEYPRITSMAALRGASSTINNTSNDRSHRDEKEYMLMTLEPKDRSSAPTNSSMVEVVCVSDIPKTNSSTASDTMASTSVPAAIAPGIGTTASVVLEDYWLLSDSGPAEIMGSATLSHIYNNRLRKNGRRFQFESHWIPSQGSHAVTSLAGDKGQFLVELADGSVVFLKSSFIPSDNQPMDDKELQWGVQRQYLLPYPTIGRGIVTLSDGKDYVACVLRGGTVFMFPLDGVGPQEVDEPANHEMEGAGRVRLCPYPDDISQDSIFQHLQSFVAGNVHLSGLVGVESPTLPLLFFCWPGGAIDVYCAHLLPSSTAQRRKDLLSLMDNGAVSDLFRLLCSLSNDPDNLLSSNLWAKAQEQVMSFGRDASSLTLTDLESDILVDFVKLLLELAEPSTRLPVDLE